MDRVELVPRRRKAFYFDLLASRSCERTVALASQSETIYFVREDILILYLHYATEMFGRGLGKLSRGSRKACLPFKIPYLSNHRVACLVMAVSRYQLLRFVTVSG